MALVGVVYVVLIVLIGMGHPVTLAFQVAAIGGAIGIGLGTRLNQYALLPASRGR
ncbi:hypothetical protein AB0L88_33010 [Saccharopolyspora shandongensis]|uniref:hypothetical protein n=1 Tax=Saccharopolyspora shandongensis TaxID=418495 RepID=UPI0034366450